MIEGMINAVVVDIMKIERDQNRNPEIININMRRGEEADQDLSKERIKEDRGF
jgi:hypothetical protein